MKLRILTLSLLLGLTHHLLAQISGVINEYTPVTGFNCDSSVLKVGPTAGFFEGDLVLIIQMQGAVVSLENDNTFGTILSAGNAGNYEFNRIKSVGNGEVRLLFKMTRPYDVAGKIQLVRVPEYVDVAEAGLTCKPWDGTTGGILALDVAGTLTMQGAIDASYKGFRGGQVVDADVSVYHETAYFYPFDPALSGAKGESIAIMPADKSYGRGRTANGGGGGNAHNAGGGGGGNGGNGGNGGLEYYNTPGSPSLNTNGLAGQKIYEQDGGKAIMGGGGGAGQANDGVGISGGNGGGIIFLRANVLNPNSFKLYANGGDVIAPGTNRNDGQGGGGAGGTVMFRVNQVNSHLDIEFKGGRGGDCLFSVNSQIIGPGGGGGGGKAALFQASPNVFSFSAGGQNGIANQGLTNGAQSGASGWTFLPANFWPDDAIPTDTIPVTTEVPVSFCPGEVVTIDGQDYTDSGIVFDTLSTGGGCDSIIQYVLTLLPQPLRANSISFCAGESVVIGGQTYTQSGTVIDTIPGTMGCDTIVTYTLIKRPSIEVFNDLGLCPNEAFNLHGIDYYAPGEVSDTLTGVFGCDSIIHYGLLLLPQPTRSLAISLCPGESALIGGHSYTQPGTVIDTIPASMGCDTIVTYTITSPLPASSVVSIHCPANISVIADPGTAPLVVNYDPPTATSNCPCPGVALTQTAGLPSGGAFPNGVTQVCYAAKDSCGHSASCCFTVTVREVQPCDVKVNGCIRYELLSITADPAHNLTYRIRVVNNCANKLIYTAIQLPDAVVALAPNNLSVFTAESGREYDVRNPNFSPFYSIRFKSIQDSISGGESDIFKFTLPAQSAPLYMDITSRLATQVFYEAHLNTFYCPIGITMNRSDDAAAVLQQGPLLFPNPTDGTLWVDLGDWNKGHFHWRIFNSQGQQIMTDAGTANEELLRIEMTRGIPDGLFFFEIMHDNGQKETMRFVLQR